MTFQQINIPPQPSASASPAPTEAAKPATPEATKSAEAAPAAEAPKAETTRPTWLPEKFKSAEDMAKAYFELEKKQSGKLDTIEPAPKVNFDSYAQEFSEKGELSEDSFAALEKSGVSRQMVQQYIDGAKAIAEQQVNQIVSEVGGKETYSKMLQWAASSLPPEEIKAFNTAVSSGDTYQRMLAVKGLYAQFSGNNPNLLSGRASGASSAQPFENWAQVKVAMSDRRYETDPAYRDSVAARLRNSPKL